MISKKIVFSFSLITTACLISLPASAKSTKQTDSICTGPDGHHICMVYNYSERKVWASYEKMNWKEKSVEQRKAKFPGSIPEDNGKSYSLSSASALFKPFSVTYKGSQGGCKFTFSPPTGASQKTAPKGYVITSEGVGNYTNDSCQHDGASLIINEH